MPNADDSDVASPADHQDPDWLPPELNTGVAHTARVYNYWLGGKENFAADRALGDAIIAALPTTRLAARANRAFLGRAVRYLAAEAGIRRPDGDVRGRCARRAQLRGDGPQVVGPPPRAVTVGEALPGEVPRRVPSCRPCRLSPDAVVSISIRDNDHPVSRY
jgi:hypothetical protein